MKTVDVSSIEPESMKNPLDLDARYLRIGISAVAAAVRYQSDSRNPAYAPSEPHLPPHITDEAA
ncbi:MAG TPA: hypothetical protein VG985_00940 [Xanthobacteraceae bacterium]|nr:hypothetical protein [Xanthobacteraceae bacterium]